MRGCGILLHISSLPGGNGIGAMGEQAYRFADFLKASGQSLWQVLPLGPTGAGDSPYSPFSAFAGSPYLIDLDLLNRDGLLLKDEYEGIGWGENGSFVDFGRMYELRLPLLRLAYARFKPPADMDAFIRENGFWLDGYAMFMALRSRFGERGWLTWPDAARRREPGLMARLRGELAGEYDFHIFLQYIFFKQWKALKLYANARGVRIIGDVPIYVSPDSADAWTHQDMLLLGEDCRPSFAAGVPPDYYRRGSFWGNPVYDWGALKASGYRWWKERMKHSLRLFDRVRIDHFRGFDSFYAIPAGETTAVNGSWMPGPGMDFFNAVGQELGDMDVIAEDLGLDSQSVRELLRATGYPGMKVLQFAFSPDGKSAHLPHNFERGCVVYTGTHDNDTTAGWLAAAPEAERDFAAKYLPGEGVWDFIRCAYASVADTAIIPMQDFLGLASGHRMNIPSTPSGNWRWRLAEPSGERLADRIGELGALYGRNS